jgi:hypothetical protein
MYEFLKTRIDVRLLLLVVLAAVCVVGGLFVTHATSRWRAKADRQRAKTNKLYAEIQQDICAALTKKMESLPDDDPIIRRYGRFRHLRVKQVVSNPSYTWKLVERLRCGVVLEFEKGNAGLLLVITHGPLADITRLDMTPSEQWLNEHPESFDGFELKTINGIENNMCMKLKGGGLTVAMLDGLATHPSGPYYGPPPPSPPSPPPDYP